jgi:hypothetical protein
MGGGNNAAINIGGKAQTPSAEDVFDLARKFISKDFINKDTP